MAKDYPIPTTAELDDLYESVKNWGRWGVDDERGTLNHLTDDRRVAAAGLVRTGESISLSHNLATEPMPDHQYPVLHHMLGAGDALDTAGIPDYENCRDFLSFNIHGLYTTHVDALSHVFVRGQMFGGRPTSEVRSDGARSNTVLSMGDGVVGRGVLLDIPRALGCAFLDTGEMVTVRDLETAEEAQNVHVGPGDVLFVQLGREARRSARDDFDGFSGVHAECLPWFQEREIAVLGSDGISDPLKPYFETPGWPLPIHQIGLAGMGMPLIDSAGVAELSERCAALQRWAFFFSMNPLRIIRGTGCPVNPLAIF